MNNKKVKSLFAMVVAVLASGLAYAMGLPKDMPRIPVELPEGYTQVAYVQLSTGTETIDSGYIPAVGDWVEMDLVYDGPATTADSSIAFGTRYADSNGWSFYMYVGGTHNGLPAYCENSGNTYGTELFPVGQRVKLKCQNKIASWSDTACITNTTAHKTAKASLAIGAQNYSQDGGWLIYQNFSSKMKVYSFKVYGASNTLRCNLVPCRTSEGAVGLYDLNTGTFHGNGGTGTLIAGTDVQMDYERLEYVQLSTGKEAVNSGYTPVTGDRVVLDLMYDGPATEADISIAFGTRYADSNGWSFNMYVGGTHNGLPAYCENSSNTYGTELFPVGQRVKIECKGGAVSWLGKARIVLKTKHADGKAPLGIGVLNNANNGTWVPAVGYRTKMKVYSFRVLDTNNVLKCEMIPCRRTSDGCVGLCDAVTGTFHGNGGVGELVAGPVLSYKQLKYAQFTGAEVADSGYVPITGDWLAADFRFDGPKSETSADCIFGSRHVPENAWLFNAYVSGGHNGVPSYCSGATYATYGTELFEVGTRVKMECKGRTASWAGGLKSITSTADFADGLDSLAIGSLNIGHATEKGAWYPNMSYCAKMRLYFFKVFDKDDAIKCDIIPCQMSDGTVRLVDLVMDRVCYNEGTLVAGPVKQNLGFMAIVR